MSSDLGGLKWLLFYYCSVLSVEQLARFQTVRNTRAFYVEKKVVSVLQFIPVVSESGTSHIPPLVALTVGGRAKLPVESTADVM